MKKVPKEGVAAFVGSALSLLTAAFMVWGRFTSLEAKVDGVVSDVQLIKSTLIEDHRRPSWQVGYFPDKQTGRTVDHQQK